jgi:hypothetical protein
MITDARERQLLGFWGQEAIILAGLLLPQSYARTTIRCSEKLNSGSFEGCSNFLNGLNAPAE